MIKQLKFKNNCILPVCMCTYCATWARNVLGISWYHVKWLHWHNFLRSNTVELEFCWPCMCRYIFP